jgi:hypothetical protein
MLSPEREDKGKYYANQNADARMHTGIELSAAAMR